MFELQSMLVDIYLLWKSLYLQDQRNVFISALFDILQITILSLILEIKLKQ